MAIAAVGQLCSTSSMTHNLEQCVKLIGKAAAAGAKICMDDGSIQHIYFTGVGFTHNLTWKQVLFLPEASDYIASSPQESLSLAQPESKSPFVLGLQSEARKHNLAINVGIHVPVPVKPDPEAGVSTNRTQPAASAEEAQQTKLLNRTIWIDADGTLNPAGTYDKLHLFDYANLRESAHTQGGRAIVPPFDTALGRVGSLICFDLRFPEPSLALGQPSPASPWHARPAHIITYPSAFTVPTGLAHWEVLLRARAIETQCFVVAAAQVGAHNGKRLSYGRSMVVDPWGRVLCRLKGVGEDGVVEEGAVGELGIVDVDLEEWDRVRGRMPLVRRTDVYPEI